MGEISKYESLGGKLALPYSFRGQTNEYFYYYISVLWYLCLLGFLVG